MCVKRIFTDDRLGDLRALIPSLLSADYSAFGWDIRSRLGVPASGRLLRLLLHIKPGFGIMNSLTMVAIDRFNKKYVVSSEQFWNGAPCWLWTAHKIEKGYGIFHFERRDMPAHRFSYEYHIGKIPEGLTIDHLCRVRNCVNPAHMEPVTNRVNGLRGFSVSALNARKTHCPRGHELAGNNLKVNHLGRRFCAICRKEQANRWARKNRSTPKTKFTKEATA